MNYEQSKKGALLVAIFKYKEDFEIAKNEHWYRIPVTSVDNFHFINKEMFPPQKIAFYQTKQFGDEAYAINYYADVLNTTKIRRSQLFPNEIINQKSNLFYYKLELAPLQKLTQPIYSRRLRRITFISTTWEKFNHAIEINDLWNGSPLEDKLWSEFKRLNITAERQEEIKIKSKKYFLDFAIYCDQGNINVETDGDTYHSSKQQICQDLERDNNLETKGWRVLRFNTNHVQEKMTEYCLPTIIDNINILGGIKNINNEKYPSKKIITDSTTKCLQLNLFDYE